MNRTWHQDVLCSIAQKTIDNFNTRLALEYGRNPEGSQYVKGVPKENGSEYSGIYFEDPTAFG